MDFGYIHVMCEYMKPLSRTPLNFYKKDASEFRIPPKTGHLNL